MIALIILPIVVGGVSVMLLTVLKQQTSVSNRLTGSIDTQASSALMIRDIQNSAFLTTTSTPSCGNTGTQILGLKSQGNQVYVSYDIKQVGSNYYLFRFGCAAGNTTTPAADTQLAYDVPSGQSVTVSCSSTITCTTSVTNAGWISTAGVTQVMMNVTEPNTGTVYQVKATPRLWNPASAGLSTNPFPIAPVILLSSGTCPQTVLSSPSGSSHLYVGGTSGNAPVVDESTCAPSIVMGGTSSIVASGLQVGDPTPATSVSGPAGSTPTPTYAAPSGNPFASLVAPTAPSNATVGSCGATSNNAYVGNCNPGDYTAAISLGNNAIVTFTSGTYVFDQPMTLAGTVTFSPGSYYFKGGLSMTNAANVTFDTGLYYMSGTTSATNALTAIGNTKFQSGPGGVLIYISQGTASFVNGATIALSGMNSYDGIAIWDAGATNSNPLTLGGGSSTNAAYGGVYVPNGQVASNNGAVFSAAFIVAQTLSMSGNAGVYAG